MLQGASENQNFLCVAQSIENVKPLASGEHWQRLCDAMGRPEYRTDERFARTRDRARNMDEVDAVVEEWARALTKREIFAIAEEAGMIRAPVQTLDEVVNGPQLLARGTLAWGDDRWGERSLRFHTPIRFKDMDTPSVPDMADLGVNSESVLIDFLGMDRGQLAQLRDQKAIWSLTRSLRSSLFAHMWLC